MSREAGKEFRSKFPTLNHVTSSNILGVSYDEEKKACYVLFNNGGLYVYDGVELDTYVEFLNSPSPGSYLYRNIKPNYAATKITKSLQHLIINHKNIKYVLIDIDDERGYAFIDGTAHKIFGFTPEGKVIQ